MITFTECSTQCNYKWQVLPKIVYWATSFNVHNVENKSMLLIYMMKSGYAKP